MTLLLAREQRFLERALGKMRASGSSGKKSCAKEVLSHDLIAARKLARGRAASVPFGLTLRPILLRLGDIGVQPPLADREPGARHQILIIGEVDLGQAHHREDFA